MKTPTEKSSLLQFPCHFPIKIVARACDDPETMMTAILCKHLVDTLAPQITVRPSEKGNFVAVTATIFASSQQQVDAIYAELSANNKIIMAL